MGSTAFFFSALLAGILTDSFLSASIARPLRYDLASK